MRTIASTFAKVSTRSDQAHEPFWVRQASRYGGRGGVHQNSKNFRSVRFGLLKESMRRFAAVTDRDSTHGRLSHSAVQGVHDTLKALRDGAKPSELKNIASADLQRRVLRQDDYGRWTKEFIGRG